MPNVKNRYIWLPLFRLNLRTEGFPSDDVRKIFRACQQSTDGHGTKPRRKIAENFSRLSRAQERYRRQTTDRQTDGTAIAYSEREREREFTFAKNRVAQKKPATMSKQHSSLSKESFDL